MPFTIQHAIGFLDVLLRSIGQLATGLKQYREQLVKEVEAAKQL